MGDKGGGPRPVGCGLRGAPQDRPCALGRPASVLAVLYLPPGGAGLLCGRPGVVRDCHYPGPCPSVRGQGAAFLLGPHRPQCTPQSTRLCALGTNDTSRCPRPPSQQRGKPACAPGVLGRAEPAGQQSACRRHPRAAGPQGAGVGQDRTGCLATSRQRRAGTSCDVAPPVRHPPEG